MECCASLAAVLKLSPSLRSSREAVASISSRSVSSFCRSLSVKSLWLEVMLVQRSLQPPPLSAAGIPRSHVAGAPWRGTSRPASSRAETMSARLWTAPFSTRCTR